MTKEEAINMLQGMRADNLNLNDAYTKDKYEALGMAIKVLEQKPKFEWQQDHEILKAYSDGANAVLDNVRAEIESKYESIPETFHHYETGFTDALEWVLSIIDKYKAEGSDKE